MVSLVVPAYNEGMVIEAAICSLLELDYPNYEILVIDDLRLFGAEDIETADGEWRDGDWVDFNPLQEPKLVAVETRSAEQFVAN